MYAFFRLGLVLALQGALIACADPSGADGGRPTGLPDAGSAPDAANSLDMGQPDPPDSGALVDAGFLIRAGGLVPTAATATNSGFRLRGRFVPSDRRPAENDTRRLRGGLISATR